MPQFKDDAGDDDTRLKTRGTDNLKGGESVGRKGEGVAGPATVLRHDLFEDEENLRDSQRVFRQTVFSIPARCTST
jgi:hypothetical protein